MIYTVEDERLQGERSQNPLGERLHPHPVRPAVEPVVLVEIERGFKPY